MCGVRIRVLVVIFEPFSSTNTFVVSYSLSNLKVCGAHAGGRETQFAASASRELILECRSARSAAFPAQNAPPIKVSNRVRSSTLSIVPPSIL